MHVRALLAALFAEVRDAGEAVAAIIAGGIIPAGLEMMDQLAIVAAEKYVGAGYPIDAKAMLICELDGEEGDVASELERVAEICRAAGCVDVPCPGSGRGRATALLGGAQGRFSGHGPPRPRLLLYRRHHSPSPAGRCTGGDREAFGPSRPARGQCVHAGDGNLHPLISTTAGWMARERAEALGGAILELCVQVGGTITGEHGVGREKITQMCVQFSSAELTAFAAIKTAFDPMGLLNPGKVVPTLARCAEFGAMHVHSGKLPFAQLDCSLEDQTSSLAARVREAACRDRPEKHGRNTKAFLGRQVVSEPFEVSGHTGVIDYAPNPGRSSPPERERRSRSSDCWPRTIRLGVRTPDFDAGGSIEAWSLPALGPRRPFVGAQRPSSVTVLDGRGESLRSGG